MNIFKYSQKEKNRQPYCEACGRSGLKLHAHHLYHRTYSEDCIWVCFACHRAIHDDPEWAYAQGYLVKRGLLQNTVMKNKKIKVCKHGSSYYDHSKGTYICQFCHKPVKTLMVGKSKAPKKVTKKDRSCSHSKTMYHALRKAVVCIYCGKEVTEFKNNLAKSSNNTTQAAIKMGYEQRDPREKRAEQLKQKVINLTKQIKLNADKPALVLKLKQEREVAKAEAIKLQNEYLGD